jgi:serine/threonine protein kinase
MEGGATRTHRHMSGPRQPPPPRAPSFGARSRSGPEPTEQLPAAPEDDWDASAPEDLPRGTRDGRVRSVNTRIDSPAAKVRTPAVRPPPVPPPAERADERIGQILGTYRLLELIGKGGMGFVYRAEHVRLGREVALKLLRTDYAKRRDAVSRFFQEARTVNRVRHRNIVDVTDFLELEDGTTFIIMELLRGKSLTAWARGGFELARALAALIQICDGLSAAHAVGVIHRDLKPDNIVLVPTPDGAELVKLLDFGVAKLLNRDDEDIGLETAAGSVIGTPAYMSPEQAGGLVVDHRADLYSLGAIMYELFCGQPLYRGRSFGEYVRKHLTEVPVAPRQTPGGAGMDPRLEGVILRALAKDPEARYPTAEALRDDLMHLLAAIETRPHELLGLSESGRAWSPGEPAPASSFAPALSFAPSGSYPPPGLGYGPPPASVRTAPRRARWLWGAAAAVVIGASVAGGLLAASSGTRDPELEAAAPATPTAAAGQVAAASGRVGPIRVRVEAPSGAEVAAAGSTAALCTTPCQLAIDPSDGGSTSRRDFVVRKAGFVDAPFSIDLGKPPPMVEIALATAAAPAPALADEREATGREATGREATSVRTGRESTGARTGRDTTARRPEPRPPTETPTVEPPRPVDPPPPNPGAGSGSSKRPKDTKVDPTATIDPFAEH